MDSEVIARIPGATKLIEWFGRFPSFHDATLTRLFLDGEGSGAIELKAFQMTHRVDPSGRYVLDKHFNCKITFESAESVALSAFQPGRAIVFELSIQAEGDALVIHIESSYGIEGRIVARDVAIEFSPLPPPA